jgi:hypothetical protein
LQIQLERAVQARRAGLVAELEDSNLALEKTKSQLKAIAEKFAVVGGARSALYMRPQSEIAVEIQRKAGDAVNAMQATVDTPVVPGDVIEVDVKSGRMFGVASYDHDMAK